MSLANSSIAGRPHRSLLALAVINALLHSIVTMKKIIHLLLACLVSQVVIAADQFSGPVFQMRLVAEASSEGTEEMVVVGTGKETAQKETLPVLKKVLIDQKDLKSARVNKDQLGRPQIEIRFTDEGKKRFAEVTRDSIGKRLAIVIGGQLYSAPKIMAEISGGTAMISGSFSEQEAKELADRITEALKKQ
jgi:preprotein translocase subunit SecD